MLDRALKIIVQVVHVHVAVAETATRRHMKVANNFVDPQRTFDPASFLSLRIKAFRIAFSLALLNVLASTKCPGHRSVCFAHLLAGIATASL